MTLLEAAGGFGTNLVARPRCDTPPPLPPRDDEALPSPPATAVLVDEGVGTASPLKPSSEPASASPLLYPPLEAAAEVAAAAAAPAAPGPPVSLDDLVAGLEEAVRPTREELEAENAMLRSSLRHAEIHAGLSEQFMQKLMRMRSKGDDAEIAALNLLRDHPTFGKHFVGSAPYDEHGRPVPPPNYDHVLSTMMMMAKSFMGLVDFASAWDRRLGAKVKNAAFEDVVTTSFFEIYEVLGLFYKSPTGQFKGKLGKDDKTDPKGELGSPKRPKAQQKKPRAPKKRRVDSSSSSSS